MSLRWWWTCGACFAVPLIYISMFNCFSSIYIFDGSLSNDRKNLLGGKNPFNLFKRFWQRRQVHLCGICYLMEEGMQRIKQKKQLSMPNGFWTWFDRTWSMRWACWRSLEWICKHIIGCWTKTEGSASIHRVLFHLQHTRKLVLAPNVCFW